MKLQGVIAALALLLVIGMMWPGCGRFAKEVPLGDFPSVEELEGWLHSNEISERPDAEFTNEWWDKAEELKAAAAKAGYGIDNHWVKENDLYSVYCSATAGDEIWYWDPETNDLHRDAEPAKVKRKPLK